MPCALLLLLPAGGAFLSPCASRVPASHGLVSGFKSKPLVGTCPCDGNSLQLRGGWNGRQPATLELKNANAEKDEVPGVAGPIKLGVRCTSSHFEAQQYRAKLKHSLP